MPKRRQAHLNLRANLAKGRRVSKMARLDKAAVVECEKNKAAVVECEKNKAAVVECEKNKAAVVECEKNKAAVVECEKNKAAVVECEKTVPTPSTSSGTRAKQQLSTLVTSDSPDPIPSSVENSSSSDEMERNGITPPLVRIQLARAVTEKDDDDEYDKKYILSGSLLEAMSSVVRCKVNNCRGLVEFNLTSDRFATDVEVKCKKCSHRGYVPAKRVKSKGRPRLKAFTEVNLDVVYDSLKKGIGLSELEKKSAFLGRECFSKGSYQRHCNYLFTEMETLFNNCQKKIFSELRNYYKNKGLGEPDEDGVLDIEVSFDGTRLTQFTPGHKFHSGVGFVIDMVTGIVVDLVVLSNYCQQCEREIEEGKHKCNKNFDGPPDAMEAEAARQLWSRSESLGFRYVTFVGDGNCEAYNAVCEMNDGKGPFENVTLTKMECIEHVAKQIFPRLMNVNALANCLIIPRATMEIFKSYVGKAIRDNVGTDEQTMRRAIMAYFLHHSSSDECPERHELCPKESSSWCFYNKAFALEEKPPSHETQDLLLTKIPQEHYSLIESVFADLTDADLLCRCLKGWSENPNEALHSKLWRKIPKLRLFGLQKVLFCAQLTVLEDNFGYKKANILPKMFGSHRSITKALGSRDNQTGEDIRRSVRVKKFKPKRRK